MSTASASPFIPFDLAFMHSQAYVQWADMGGKKIMQIAKCCPGTILMGNRTSLKCLSAAPHSTPRKSEIILNVQFPGREPRQALNDARWKNVQQHSTDRQTVDGKRESSEDVIIKHQQSSLCKLYKCNLCSRWRKGWKIETRSFVLALVEFFFSNAGVAKYAN